jgi:hypothetical protein
MGRTAIEGRGVLDRVQERHLCHRWHIERGVHGQVHCRTPASVEGRGKQRQSPQRQKARGPACQNWCSDDRVDLPRRCCLGPHQAVGGHVKGPRERDSDRETEDQRPQDQPERDVREWDRRKNQVGDLEHDERCRTIHRNHPRQAPSLHLGQPPLIDGRRGRSGRGVSGLVHLRSAGEEGHVIGSLRDFLARSGC